VHVATTTPAFSPASAENIAAKLDEECERYISSEKKEEDEDAFVGAIGNAVGFYYSLKAEGMALHVLVESVNSEIQNGKEQAMETYANLCTDGSLSHELEQSGSNVSTGETRRMDSGSGGRAGTVRYSVRANETAERLAESFRGLTLVFRESSSCLPEWGEALSKAEAKLDTATLTYIAESVKHQLDDSSTDESTIQKRIEVTKEFTEWNLADAKRRIVEIEGGELGGENIEGEKERVRGIEVTERDFNLVFGLGLEVSNSYKFLKVDALLLAKLNEVVLICSREGISAAKDKIATYTVESIADELRSDSPKVLLLLEDHKPDAHGKPPEPSESDGHKKPPEPPKPPAPPEPDTHEKPKGKGTGTVNKHWVTHATEYCGMFKNWADVSAADEGARTQRGKNHGKCKGALEGSESHMDREGCTDGPGKQRRWCCSCRENCRRQ
jgi:hypothetical protein